MKSRLLIYLVYINMAPVFGFFGCDSESDCRGEACIVPTGNSSDSDASIDSEELIIDLTETDSIAYSSVVAGGDRFGYSIYWTKKIENGPCVFYEASFGDCTPECVPPEECGADNRCHNDPHRFVDAGTISVSGLKSRLSLEVVHSGGPNYYYTDYWTPEVTDGEIFDEGNTIVAKSDGGTYGAFEVSVTGCANIISNLTCPPSLGDGEHLEIRWTPGDAEKDNIRFSMLSGNHATHFSGVICETGDTGSLIVDAAIVSAFLSSHRPVNHLRLIRFREGSFDEERGRVILRATSAEGCGW